MKPVEVAKGIYWVGAIDWNIRDFHGYGKITMVAKRPLTDRVRRIRSMPLQQ